MKLEFEEQDEAVVCVDRLSALRGWLNDCFSSPEFTLTPITGDASFRSYYRVLLNQKSYMAVDAPVGYDLGSEAFIQIARAFAAQGLHVPEILASDLSQGFLLVSDLGDRLYANELTTDNADALYGVALQDLVRLHHCKSIPNYDLPRFNSTFLRPELALFEQWYLEKHLSLTLSSAENKLLKQCVNDIVTVVESQPECCVHRDYHSRNLLVLENNNVGIIDLQDAVWGPVTYDAVSLLRDCYIDWPLERVQAWALQFHDSIQESGLISPVSQEQFMRWFDFTGMQRHLKAIFIFARKYWRDHDARYLPDIQRGLSYINTVSQQYSELAPFHQWLNDVILPGHQQAQQGII